jgi:transmembrane sensor
MKTQFDDLIDKHLDGSLTEEEKEVFAKLLNVPENQLYLAGEIDKKFDTLPIGHVVDDKMEHQLYERIRKSIKEETTTANNNGEQLTPVIQMGSSKRRMLRWMAVAAASVIVVVSLVFLNSPKLSNREIAQDHAKAPDSLLAVLRTEFNNTGKDKSLLLPDGSVIILANKSEVRYYEPFTSARDITLKGKAMFQVAKDKTKPFTVISGDIATTALGTEFTVTAWENTNRIIIRLYEGKVVVKAVKPGNLRLKSDVYLLPGEELVYDKTAAKVKTFKVDTAATTEDLMKEEFFGDDASLPENTEGSWYMFNNQSLDLVFDQLAQIYNTGIIYDKKDIKNMYFIGKFDKARSLESILQRITIVNDLKVTKKDSVFVISK